jgi:hypothetical protein
MTRVPGSCRWSTTIWVHRLAAVPRPRANGHRVRAVANRLQALTARQGPSISAINNLPSRYT